MMSERRVRRKRKWAQVKQTDPAIMLAKERLGESDNGEDGDEDNGAPDINLHMVKLRFRKPPKRDSRSYIWYLKQLKVRNIAILFFGLLLGWLIFKLFE